MKVIIVGGVAGGASCAARLRRLDEDAEIVMVERGPYVSYANCGLPYHVGDVIEEESSLLVASEKIFREHFAVDVRTECEAVGISPRRRPSSCATSRPARNDRALRQAGAVAGRRIDPPAAAGHRPAGHLPGPDRAGCAGDPRMDRARHDLPRRDEPVFGVPDRAAEARAVVVGGGFIGLETAENLVHRGFEVTLVEMADQVLAPLDPERRAWPKATSSGTAFAWRSRTAWPASSRPTAARSKVFTQSGKVHPADIVILASACGPTPPWRRQPGWRSASAAASGSTTRCGPATPTSSPSAMRSRCGTSSPASGASSRSPGRRTGRAGSPPR